jgi:DNA-binding CsgD family transcriptional regulator
MGPNRVPAVRDEIRALAGRGQTWIDFTAAVAADIATVLPHTASCFHTVDPGTIILTGSVNRNVACSGSWLAHHEYVVEDVNKWGFLAHSGRIAGASSLATHGALDRSERHRSHAGYGYGDELRVPFVRDGIYWGAAAFLREPDEPWFTEADVAAIRVLAEPIAAGLQRATSFAAEAPFTDHGPGVVVFGADGVPESVSPAAERWITELDEHPPPPVPAESKVVQAIAARARSIAPGTDPLELTARARVRTRSGRWLLMYGTRLEGGEQGRTAVVIHPASPHDVAPVVALSYGLTARECEVVMLCIQGRATKDIAAALSLSPYTVQDHLKAIFGKTGAATRGELVGRVFLDHYAPRWQTPTVAAPPGVLALTME